MKLHARTVNKISNPTEILKSNFGKLLGEKTNMPINCSPLRFCKLLGVKPNMPRLFNFERFVRC